MAIVTRATEPPVFPSYIPTSASLLADKPTPHFGHAFTNEKSEISHHGYSKNEDIHITNSIDHDKKPNAHRKASATSRGKIISSEFERWIQRHGGKEIFDSALINTNYTTKSRRKRSRLSYVTYTASNDEEDDLIFTQQKEQSIDFTSISSSITTAHNYNTKTIRYSGKPLLNFDAPPKKDVQPQIEPCVTPKKNSSWFTSLFNKQHQNVGTTKLVTESTPTLPKSKYSNSTSLPLSPPASPTSPTANKRSSPANTISNFFTLKKQQQKEAATALMLSQHKKKKSSNNIPQKRQYKLPTRYPLPLERVIYQISFMKISNPRRPLIQQVTISNMVFWYTSLIQQEVYSTLDAATARYTRSSPFYQSIMYASRPPTFVTQ